MSEEEEKKHSPELESIASFRYQGMTIEQLLISLAIKQDQTLTQLFEMRNDINKKLDKQEFTYSWEPRLMKVESQLENFVKTYNDFQLAYTGDKRAQSNTMYILGGAWPVIIIFIGAVINWYLSKQ